MGKKKRKKKEKLTCCPPIPTSPTTTTTAIESRREPMKSPACATRIVKAKFWLSLCYVSILPSIQTLNCSHLTGLPAPIVRVVPVISCCSSRTIACSSMPGWSWPADLPWAPWRMSVLAGSAFVQLTARSLGASFFFFFSRSGRYL